MDAPNKTTERGHKMEEMTYQKAFEHCGLIARPIDFHTFDGSPCAWEVTNAKGHKFKVKFANWGEFTVDGEDKRLATHCLFRTAVRLIKTH